MLLNSTHLSKSFSFCILLLIINQLTLTCPLDWALLTVSWFIFLGYRRNLKSPHIIQRSIIWGPFLCAYALNRMKLTFRSILNAKQAVARFDTAAFTNKDFFNDTIDRSCNCCFHLHSFCYD